jgi:hypothetical protein
MDEELKTLLNKIIKGYEDCINNKRVYPAQKEWLDEANKILEKHGFNKIDYIYYL